MYDVRQDMDAGLAYGLGSITGMILTLILGYGAGLFWIVLGLTGASVFPLAPIVMSVSMITGTVLIGFAVVKLLDKNIHV